MSNRKIYNPKSHAPSVYIPCWLIQVKCSLLSQSAKILYGRLSQWSNSSGDVFRSTKQLSQEIGDSERGVERRLKELRDCGLIETFQPQSGGQNHFRFFEHPWMFETIKTELIYKSDPPTELSVPPDRIVGTPPTNVSDISSNKYKEGHMCEKGLADLQNLFATFKILTPKIFTAAHKRSICSTMQILDSNGWSFEKYLEYLTTECSKFIKLHENGKTKCFYVIIKPETTIKGLNREYEDYINP